MRTFTWYGLAAAATGLVFWITHNDYVATGFACVSVIVALLIALLIGRPAGPIAVPAESVPTLTGCLPRLLQWFSVLLSFLMIAGVGVGLVNFLRFELIHGFLSLYCAVILFRAVHYLGALEEHQNWPELEPR